jgi:hypothetical protein
VAGMSALFRTAATWSDRAIPEPPDLPVLANSPGLRLFKPRM